MSEFFSIFQYVTSKQRGRFCVYLTDSMCEKPGKCQTKIKNCFSPMGADINEFNKSRAFIKTFFLIWVQTSMNSIYLLLFQRWSKWIQCICYFSKDGQKGKISLNVVFNLSICCEQTKKKIMCVFDLSWLKTCAVFHRSTQYYFIPS